MTSGSGQHVIGYAEGVAPLRLEETAGTVVHVTVQADPESYEIGTYKVTLDSGAVREESVYGNGLAILDKDLVIEADATLNVGFWFNEIEKETESEEVTEVESEEITEAGSEIATEVESEDVLETETESDSETEISTEVESEVESEEGYLKIPVRFTATAGGHVELVNADGETISTVSADAPMDYLSDGVETLTAYCVPDDGYLAFAVNRTVGKSLTNFGTFENSSRVPVELSITDEESIEFVFFIEEEFADWIAKNAIPRFVKAEAPTARDISNPKVGDTFTGTAQVTGATAGYSIRDYYGDNNNPVTNYVQVTCADGELAVHILRRLLHIAGGDTHAGAAVLDTVVADGLDLIPGGTLCQQRVVHAGEDILQLFVHYLRSFSEFCGYICILYHTPREIATRAAQRRPPAAVP